VKWNPEGLVMIGRVNSKCLNEFAWV
jgi:hypothetical protein